MLTAILILFAFALLAPALQRVLRGSASWVLGLVALAVSARFAAWLPAISSGAVITESRPWAPGLGLELAFRVDGWSLLFLLLIGGIGGLILIYSGGYLHGHRDLGRFLGFILFFMGSMLGLVSADNLILVFIFWELTSFASYLLIGFNHESKASRQAALQALLVTGGGGLALLAGFLLIGQVSFSLTALLADPGVLRNHPLYPAMLLLVLGGALTKSAQVPFHFWLPGAMAAPTPVSAYLHSATMVKAGIFLLGRMNPVLGGTELWHTLLTVVGAGTMLAGAVLAVPQTDLKRLLAYSTVSALGTLTLLLGIGTTLAVKAAALFLLVHSLYKGALFMVAGTVDHETGTRDVRLLGGLFRLMPITAVAAGLAALSMSGFPPLLGFISKELLYEAKLHAPSAAPLITSAGFVANLVMVTVAIIVGFGPFHGRRPEGSEAGHEGSPALWIGPMVLAVLGAIAGMVPSLVDRPLLGAAVSAVRASETVVRLELWHGINPVLLMSVATVAGGFLLYTRRAWVRALAERLAPIAARFGPERLYRECLEVLVWMAERQTRLIQHGYLRGYILTVVVVATVLAGYALLRFGLGSLWSGFGDLRLYEAVIALMLLGAALAAAAARSRLSAVIALGVLGYGVALIYGLYGAPDLAITQILVETLTLILFVLVVVRLPGLSRLSPPKRRRRDALWAGCAGVVITLLVLKALHVDPVERVSRYHVENAPLAQGRNVVNVILVDFRALDTMGEIVVLSVAAIGVFALLKFKIYKRKEER